jgi:hypothetical protein
LRHAQRAECRSIIMHFTDFGLSADMLRAIEAQAPEN